MCYPIQDVIMIPASSIPFRYYLPYLSPQSLSRYCLLSLLSPWSSSPPLLTTTSFHEPSLVYPAVTNPFVQARFYSIHHLLLRPNLRDLSLLSFTTPSRPASSLNTSPPTLCPTIIPHTYLINSKSHHSVSSTPQGSIFIQS